MPTEIRVALATEGRPESRRAPFLHALGREARRICSSICFFGCPILHVVCEGGACILPIVDDLLPPRQFLYAFRHAPAVQFLKTHSHMVSRSYPDNRKTHG